MRPKSQITIPKEVVNQLNLSEDELFAVAVENRRIVLIPKNLSEKIPAVKLTHPEQKTLARAKAKIDKINNDLLNSMGLTKPEIAVAAKAGLVDPDQTYFWSEAWQKDERESERDIRAGRTDGPFDTAEEMLASLNS